MKRLTSFFLALLLLCSSTAALAAKKPKATPTPAPQEIGTEIIEPPEQVLRLLEVAYDEWVTVNGKDQGVKNKYTTWFNNYNWGRNSWCAGFVTWCMMEAEIPQLMMEELKEQYEEGVAPAPVFHVTASRPTTMAPGYLYMHRTSAIPQKGFVALYAHGSNKYIHVGLVYDVELLPNGKYRLTCIEGAMRNTVRMFVYDYDPTAEPKKKNVTLVPKDERTEEERKNFTYGKHGDGWHINCFLMTWVPGDDS